MLTRPRLLLILLAFLSFGNAIRGSFHFDDYSIFQSAGTWTDLFRLETTRPLTLLSFWLNRAVSGEDPLLWHVLNLALHIGCVLLLFDNARRVVGDAVALLAAGLFAIHPLQTEAVSYVFARSAILMTFLCLLAWAAWLREHRWVAVLFFGAALLAKEECVFFPIFLLLFGRRRELLAMMALSLAAGLRVVAATRIVKGSGAGFTSGITAFDYSLAQGAVLWRYLLQLVWPVGFTIDPDIHLATWMCTVGWLSLGALIYAFRKRPETRWFVGGLILLLASSSVFPASDLAADRRMYLPLISISIAIGLILVKLPRWVPVVLAGVWISLSIARTEVWRTERSLWTDAVAKAPDKVRPRIQLARAVEPEEGLTLLTETERSHPNNPDVPAERGRIYLQTRRPELAISAFGRSAALKPNDAQSWSNLGVAFVMMGQKPAANVQFKRALKIDPCLSDARKNLGLLPCQ